MELLQSKPPSIGINAIVLFVALGSLFFMSRVVDSDTLKQWVEAAGIWAPAAFVLAKVSTIVIAPLAGSFLYPLAGASFGVSKGVMLGVTGDALGSAIAFFISRRFGRPLAEKFLGGESNMLTQVLEMIGTVRGFLVARFILITAHDLLAYAAGLTRLPFVPFILIQVSVSVIPTAILTGLGSELFAGNGITSGLLLSGMMGIGVVSSLAFGLYSYLNAPKTETPRE